MPFFFIAPVWILCLLVGAVLFCFTKLRSLSLYILLASSGFTFLSFLCSTMVLLAAGKYPQLFWHSGLLAVGGYLVALLGGGVLGAVGGLALAYKLNLRRVPTTPQVERP
jgi:hypothetical protein